MKKERYYVYDPSFMKKYKEFYAIYGEKEAPERWLAWIKSTKLNPELPLEPQLAKRMGTEVEAKPKQTGTPITKVDARTGGAEIEINAEEYARQINNAWKNVSRSPSSEERKQGIRDAIAVEAPPPMIVWKDLKYIRGDKYE